MIFHDVIFYFNEGARKSFYTGRTILSPLRQVRRVTRVFFFLSLILFQKSLLFVNMQIIDRTSGHSAVQVSDVYIIGLTDCTIHLQCNLNRTTGGKRFFIFLLCCWSRNIQTHWFSADTTQRVKHAHFHLKKNYKFADVHRNLFYLRYRYCLLFPFCNLLDSRSRSTVVNSYDLTTCPSWVQSPNRPRRHT